MAVEAKISQLNAAGSNIAATSLFESSYDIGGGNFSSVKVTGTQLAAGVATILGLSLGAAFTTTPANALTLTTTGPTNVTLPTSGTLATTVTPSASVVVGGTAIAGGSSGRVLYDNGGALGEMTTTGSGTVLALSTSPVFVTPTLGVASATSVTADVIASSSTLPMLRLFQSDGATNEKYTEMFADSAGAGLRTINDAYNAAETAYLFTRSGINVTQHDWLIGGAVNATLVSGLFTVAGSYRSAAPTTGTSGAWKMGVLVTDAVVPDTTRYIQLDVGGTLYKLIVST